jgi:azurin
VLVATRLLNAGETTTLTFDAPTEAGDYPFVCTFPGHYVTMQGTMRVRR